MKKLLEKYRHMSLAAKVTIWSVVCGVLQKCIAIITTPIFTRIMTTEQYGQFTVYNSWMQTFAVLTTLRLNWGVFSKGMSKYKHDRDGYTSTMQTVTFLLTLGWFLVYLVFREPINALTELPTFMMIAMFAEMAVAPAIDFWTTRQRFDYVYKPVVLRTMLMVVLNTVLGVIAVLCTKEKGYARILTYVALDICFGIVFFVYNLNKGKTLFKWEYAKFAVAFNLPLLLHYCSQQVLDQFGKIMVQKFAGIATAGIYGVAYNMGMLMKIITQNMNSGLVPWQYEKLEKREYSQLDDVLFMVYALVGACALALSLFAPEVVLILSSRTYYEAVYAIPPLALGVFFMFMYTTFANVEFYLEKNKFSMYISLFVAVLNIALNYVLIQCFGYLAAAYVSLISYIAYAFGHYMYMSFNVKKELGVERIFNTKRLVALSAGLVFCNVGVVFLYDHIVLRYGLVAVGLVALYVFRAKVKQILQLVMARKRA